MRTTIDRAGRLVVPKQLREAVGLAAGQTVEVTAHDGRLEITVAATPMRLEAHGGHFVAVPGTNLPELTAEAVREALEQTRR